MMYNSFYKVFFIFSPKCVWIRQMDVLQTDVGRILTNTVPLERWDPDELVGDIWATHWGGVLIGP